MTASNARSGTRNLHINTSVRSCHLAVKRPLRGRVSYDDAEGGGTVVYLGAPIHSGYVLIPRAHLVNVTSLEHERWKRAPIPALPAEVALDRIPERLGRESCPSSLMRPR